MNQYRDIRLLLLDVDGVLTDGRLGLSSGGEEITFFSIHDGMGIRLAQEAGLTVGILSGRESRAMRRRARQLGIKLVLEGSEDKRKDFIALLARSRLKKEEVAYVGDDLTDLPVLAEVGFSAAPADASPDVKERVHYVARARGGKGAVREVVEHLLRASGRWEKAVAALIGGLSLEP